ncbi:unnamed protein product [Pleuronectes platessa]|uniref:Uncharacterized protein n=1 Tax=Pleuronectes platessa TaxID=8262 RepID=A0A9N7YQ57_PLEPL|nr:unnamed protein product [Pleuronectes platessa]
MSGLFPFMQSRIRTGRPPCASTTSVLGRRASEVRGFEKVQPLAVPHGPEGLQGEHLVGVGDAHRRVVRAVLLPHLQQHFFPDAQEIQEPQHDSGQEEPGQQHQAQRRMLQRPRHLDTAGVVHHSLSLPPSHQDDGMRLSRRRDQLTSRDTVWITVFHPHVRTQHDSMWVALVPPGTRSQQSLLNGLQEPLRPLDGAGFPYTAKTWMSHSVICLRAHPTPGEGERGSVNLPPPVS